MNKHGPPERGETARQGLRRELQQGPVSAKELSARLGIREKDVAEHLEHLRKSLAQEGLELTVHPASCIECGYVFRDRGRLTRPSACPKCRSTRIDPPAFSLEP